MLVYQAGYGTWGLVAFFTNRMIPGWFCGFGALHRPLPCVFSGPNLAGAHVAGKKNVFS